jgi:class 3 adenylate cyclase/tetratricopeptide (TPR) repeat protein
MTCPRCRHENRPGAKFCEECGASLVRACGSCGSELSLTAKFCPECGKPAASAAPQTRFAAPESYTPKYLAEKILTSKAALEGERKQVTVLFADLKGSMELLADRDPEEARKLLDPVIQHMMEAVHRYEGTVNQVMGDGIMALFGAPIGHEDHAVRGCYAAARMQRQISLYADDIQRAGGTPVHIRVGLNSGEVVVRSIGSDLHMDYTAVGQTTHLAARMEQMAKPGSTLITGDTLKLAEGYVQVRSLGAVPVKGLEAPTQVYELTGIVPSRSRMQASAAARGLSRFVGRESELQQLAQACERVAAGRGQTVAVVGEAGVGKSRLVWEFARSHRTQGWLVLESSSVSYGKATPYLPVIELLKAYCLIQESDDPRAIRERVAGKLLMLDRALEPLLTPLLALLDVTHDDTEFDDLDPSQRRQQILEAVKRLLLRESQVQPLLLIVEDLHWIDAESQALLDGLVDSLPTARILLLVNYRPEYQHGWGGKTYYLQLRIDPLPPTSAEALLTALLGEDWTLEPFKQALIERTEGNPFFLEESVQTLVETKVLVGERGAYRVARTPTAWQIPATAQAMLAARIDRLPPETKRLLQAASVIGKDVPFGLLQAIAEMSEDRLRWGLLDLQAAEFLYEISLFPDLEYTFKHALTHEVAYGSVLQDRRRALHAGIAQAIEVLYSERLTEQIERLAYHALRGELRDKAVHYLRQAGLKAAARWALSDARTWFEQALDALEALRESASTLEEGFEIRLELRPVLVQLGEIRRVLDRLHEAEVLAERLNDDRRRGQVCVFMTNIHSLFGELDEALVTGTRAVEIARRLGDLRLRILATSLLVQAHYWRGEHERVVELGTDNLAALPVDWVHDSFGQTASVSIFDRMWLVVSLAELGRFTEAIEYEAEVIGLAEPTHHPYTVGLAYYAAGTLHLLRGEWARARSVIEHWVAVLQTGNAVFLLPFAVASSAWAFAQLGETDDALNRLREGQQLLEGHMAKGIVGNCGWDYHSLGRACLLLGQLDEARRLGDRAMECSPRQPGFAAHALHLLGDIATHPDRFDADRGEGHYRQALMLAEPRGMRPLVAHCHLGLGKLYRRTGQREQAREHLTTATTMYREMDMRFLASAGRGGDGSVTAKFIDVRAPDRRHRHYRKLRDSLSRC